MSPKSKSGEQTKGSDVGGQRQGQRRRARGPRKKTTKAAAEPPVLVDPEFAVMAREPIRTSIVAMGHQHLISPVEVAEVYDLDVKYVSDQFRALVKVDLLELVEEVKVRGVVQHMYRSTKRAFVATGDWSQFGEAIQTGMSGAIMQDLNSQVARGLEAGTLDSRDSRWLWWQCMLVDEVAWEEAEKIVAWAVEALREQSVEAINRHARGESTAVFPATYALLSFESPTEAALQAKRKQARGRGKAPREGKGRKR